MYWVLKGLRLLLVLVADDVLMLSCCCCWSEMAMLLLLPPPPPSFPSLNRFFFLKTLHTTQPSSCTSIHKLRSDGKVWKLFFNTKHVG